MPDSRRQDREIAEVLARPFPYWKHDPPPVPAIKDAHGRAALRAALEAKLAERLDTISKVTTIAAKVPRTAKVAANSKPARSKQPPAVPVVGQVGQGGAEDGGQTAWFHETVDEDETPYSVRAITRPLGTEPLVRW